MSFIGGYQSDVNLNDINYVGDFPIDHAIGGFGTATGGSDNFILALTPPISGYRIGLPLAVQFAHTNTGPVTLNVDGRGIISIKKIVNGILAEMEAGDIGIFKIYLLVFDGTDFQIANVQTIPFAGEANPGIAQIATQPEVNAGSDNAKIVTPQKLAAYVADKITGLWEDKGLIDCSTNPNYPPGETGDAYIVSAAGKIGGMDGVNVGVKDVIYCNEDNPGGENQDVGMHWTVIQANLEQASEVITGYARIATQAELTAGSDDNKFITPLKLVSWFVSQLATELQAGISERATQAEVNAGLDDLRYISPLKLASWFTTKTATEAVAGIAEIASQAEINAGLDDQRFVTPAKLAVYVANKITGLWEDKGLIDASANPNYPAGQVGDAYTVSVAGKIGGALGPDVQVRDVIYCTLNNAGGSHAAVGSSWNIIQSNLVQATEAVAGYIQIASQAEVNAGVDNTKSVTALKLATWFALQLATETVAGISERATQAEVNLGTDDVRYVSPLKLLTLLNSLLQFAAGTGTNAIIPKNVATNTAAGQRATVVNGSNNDASGFESLAHGQGAVAQWRASRVQSPGLISGQKGKAEHADMVLYMTAYGGIISTLQFTGSRFFSGANPDNVMMVDLDVVVSFTLKILFTNTPASSATPGNSRVRVYEGLIRRTTAGGITLIGTVDNTLDKGDAGTFPSVAVNADGSNYLGVVLSHGGAERYNVVAHVSWLQLGILN